MLRGAYPFSGQPMFAQMRFNAAGELAGARGSFGRVGARWADLAQIAVTALTQNQEAGALLLGTRNLDRRQQLRDYRDITKVAHQQSELS